MINSIFNWISDKISYVLQAVLLLLPDSPFVAITKDADIQQVLGWLNWFIPVSQMVAILEVWLVAVALFYVYQMILRFAKVIE